MGGILKAGPVGSEQVIDVCGIQGGIGIGCQGFLIQVVQPSERLAETKGQDSGNEHANGNQDPGQDGFPGFLLTDPGDNNGGQSEKSEQPEAE